MKGPSSTPIKQKRVFWYEYVGRFLAASAICRNITTFAREFELLKLGSKFSTNSSARQGEGEALRWH